MTQDEAIQAALRHVGSRVRIYYHTRTYAHDGAVLSVWGDNATDVDTVATAYTIARVLAVTPSHVVVQPDNQARPVAIHRSSVVSVAKALLTSVGSTSSW